MCKAADTSVPVGDGKIPPSLRIHVPDHPAAWEALAKAEEKLPAAILNHSFRTYIYAKAFLNTQQADRPLIDGLKTNYLSPVRPFFIPLEALFVACIYHDLGTSTDYDETPVRFEIDGADEIALVLRKHGLDESVIYDSWLASALHDTPGVPDRLGGSIRAVRLGIRADFGGEPPAANVLPDGISSREDLNAALPRLDIEKVLGDAVVRAGLTNAHKSPGGTWPGEMVRSRRENPDWTGVNKRF